MVLQGYYVEGTVEEIVPMVENFLAKLCCQISLTSALLARVLPSALALNTGRDDGAGGATVRSISFCKSPISFCTSVATCGRVTVDEIDVHLMIQF